MGKLKNKIEVLKGTNAKAIALLSASLMIGTSSVCGSLYTNNCIKEKNDIIDNNLETNAYLDVINHFVEKQIEDAKNGSISNKQCLENIHNISASPNMDVFKEILDNETYNKIVKGKKLENNILVDLLPSAGVGATIVTALYAYMSWNEKDKNKQDNEETLEM